MDPCRLERPWRAAMQGLRHATASCERLDADGLAAVKSVLSNAAHVESILHPTVVVSS
jgi:hypothetical protein